MNIMLGYELTSEHQKHIDTDARQNRDKKPIEARGVNPPTLISRLDILTHVYIKYIIII